MNYKKIIVFITLPLILLQTACKKLVTVDEPISSITTQEAFSTDAQATAAMAGVYAPMINGTTMSSNNVYTGFAAGLSTMTGGFSSDELEVFGGTNPLETNQLTGTGFYYVNVIWTSAYKTIYNANGVIEGIAASTSGDLHDSVRKELTAEAKFVRAFAYTYLVNFFGDVPLALTVDFNKTANMARTPAADVYKQIVQDLKDAQADLAADFTYGYGERIIPNKYAATALLARVYLYLGQYDDAAAQASTVISNTAQYSLVQNLNNVFLKNSAEAIWQLKQDSAILAEGTATPEGIQFLPSPTFGNGQLSENLSSELVNSFESGDLRRTDWVDSTDGSVYGLPAGNYYFAYKYKVGSPNFILGGVDKEYYMALRLAEQYLIRAEAEAKGSNGGASAAIADLNVLRNRAGLGPISSGITSDSLWSAVAHERQAELFCEWGHRWFDLRRMGLAHDVLSAMAVKQPWAGDYQFLYPIPTTEIVDDHFLVQNPGYH